MALEIYLCCFLTISISGDPHHVQCSLACEFVSTAVIVDLKMLGFDEVKVKPFKVSDLRKLTKNRLTT